MTTSCPPLRIGVIGCGGFTAGKHLPNLAANPRLCIQALCDTDAGALAQLVDRYQPTQATGDFREVCANPQVDALLIGTKPKNSLEIAKRAGTIYDKLCGFVEDMEKIGRQLNTCHQTYDTAMTKLSQGRGNLIAQAGQLTELGVQVRKEISRSVTEKAGMELKN